MRKHFWKSWGNNKSVSDTLMTKLFDVKSGLTRASAIRSLETAQCDTNKVAWCAGDEWVRFAVNLIQLCVQIGAGSRDAHQLLPPKWRGKSATLQRETGYQTLECKG